MIDFQKSLFLRFLLIIFGFFGTHSTSGVSGVDSSLQIGASAEARPAGRGWPRGGRDRERPEDDRRGGSCNAFGCYEDGGGCNAFGCYPRGAGCNAFGCWQSPYGSCNAFGCSNNGTCTAFGCP